MIDYFLNKDGAQELIMFKIFKLKNLHFMVYVE